MEASFAVLPELDSFGRQDEPFPVRGAGDLAGALDVELVDAVEEDFACRERTALLRGGCG